VIAVAIVAVVYLVVGSAVNLLRGQRGLEIIPNSGFWIELPSLVIDGFKFVFRTITCQPSKEYSHI